MTDEQPDIRDKRSGVIIRAAIDIDGRRVERRVRNLSLRGACVDNDGDLVAGMVVRVWMGGLTDLLGEVMWARPQLAGLRFRQAIDLELARRPRQASTTPQAGWMADMGHAYRRRG